MLRTLLRITFSHLWQFEIQDGLLQVGAGWIMLLVTAFLLVPGIRARLSGKLSPSEKNQQLIHFGILFGIFVFLGFKGSSFFPEGLPVFGYGFMLFVGFLCAGAFASFRAGKVGLSRDLMWDLGMGILFFGVIGSRLFYLIQYRDRVFAGKHGIEIFKTIINLPDGGLVFYGGLIMAVFGYVLICKMKKISPHFLADVIVPSIFIGLAFGRIGCFLNGCCFGDESTLPWAVSFPPESPPYMTFLDRGIIEEEAAKCVPLHPTQIYSSINAFILAFVTACYFPYRTKDGAVLLIAMLLYPISRFTIEILRSDEMGKFNTSLTISQWVSIGLFLSGVIYFLWLSRYGKTLTTHIEEKENKKN